MALDGLKIINDTGSIIQLLLIIPLLLNLKYYRQTKIKDYLYVSLLFTFYALGVLTGAYWNFRDNYWTWQISYSLLYLSTFFGILIAIRTKWEKPPRWASGIAYSFIAISILNQIPSPTNFIGTTNTYWIGQIYFNPLQLLGSLFAVYCFITTPVEIVSNSKANISRRLWIAYFLFSGNQQFLYYTIAVIPDLPFDEYTIGMLIIWQTNGLITNLIILILHLFFPEAVLFSYEHLHRAKHLYKKLEIRGNIIQKIGISTIRDYINSIPDDLKKGLVVESLD